MRRVLFLALLALACSKEGTSKAPAPASDKPAMATAPAAAAAAPEHKLAREGTAAPAFEAQALDATGQTVNVKLADYAGKPVVLYFYPKDDTPGCTAEAQAFTAERAKFDEVGAQILGVSLDTVESHKAFAEKYDLSIPLVADPGGAIATSYGVDTSRGVAKRTTFVIGPDGKIFRVFPDVRVAGHETEVLDAVKKSAGKG